MNLHVDPVTASAYLALLLLTALSGLVISRFRRPAKSGLEEWGLGGRQFGTLMTWFLVGGDFYTAYTIIAVPALIFVTGGAGFFAVPYTIIVYPFVFVTMPRLWAVANCHGLVTPADFVKIRYGSHWLASAVALTGILALVPYITLQFSGIEAVLVQLGVTGSGTLARTLPMLAAFAAVASFTFVAGLRAPALIAFAKDVMIYIVVIAAVLLLPMKFGGYHHVFAMAEARYIAQGSGGVILKPAGFSGYASLALGSALAAFMYPHTVTSVLASSGAQAIRKNAILLPAYTLLLGLVAMLGLVGAAAGLKLHSPKDVFPALLAMGFSRWFLGISLGAITVAALVPAAIMSIAAANLFTRNLYLEYIAPQASASAQASVAKYASLAVNFGALALALAFPTQFAINLQLLGGVLILQTFPSIVFGLWKRLFHHGALLLGWAVSIVLAFSLLAPARLQSSVYSLQWRGHQATLYVGIISLVVNLLVTAVSSWALDVVRSARLPDGTQPGDYLA